MGPGGAPKIRVVGLDGPSVRYPDVIGNALVAAGADCEVHALPFKSERPMVPATVRAIRTAITSAEASTYTVYCSGLPEWYLKDADLSLHFSAYSAWFDPGRMRIIPHPWSLPSPLEGVSLRWSGKPALNVSFLGATYASSRASRWAGAAPRPVRAALMRGDFLRSATLLSWLTVMKIPVRYPLTCARWQTLEAVEQAKSRLPGEVILQDSGMFTGAVDQVSRYARLMHDTTYVLCPRGIENFSYRMFEALKFGRVPVVIDSGMVLPPGFPWDEVILRVPYADYKNVADCILEDHQRSPEFFLERQDKALRLSEALSSEEWLRQLADEIVGMARAKAAVAKIAE